MCLPTCLLRRRDTGGADDPRVSPPHLGYQPGGSRRGGEDGGGGGEACQGDRLYVGPYDRSLGETAAGDLARERHLISHSTIIFT